MTTLNATPASLPAVLKSAAAGDTITLADGLYAKIVIDGLRNASLITVTGGPGAKVRELQISGSRGWRFTGLDFDAGSQGYFMYRVEASEDVHFDYLTVHGVRGGQYPPSGISFLKGCVNISVTDSELSDLYRGVAAGSCDLVVIARNRFRDMVTDGFDGADCRNVRIVDNDFRAVHPTPGDHPDAIQFWTQGTSRSSADILIARNLIERGDGPGLQGIFLKDEIGNLPYRRVRIEDNLLVGAGYNGVLCNHGEDFTVVRNELLSVDADTGRNWMLIQETIPIVVSGNSAIAITINGKALASGEGGNLLNKPMTDGGAAAVSAWRAKFRAPVTPTPDPIPEPPKPDALRAALALNTGAKTEPLKKSGRLTVNFKTPAQASAALAAIQAL